MICNPESPSYTYTIGEDAASMTLFTTMRPTTPDVCDITLAPYIISKKGAAVTSDLFKLVKGGTCQDD